MWLRKFKEVIALLGKMSNSSGTLLMLKGKQMLVMCWRQKCVALWADDWIQAETKSFLIVKQRREVRMTLDPDEYVSSFSNTVFLLTTWTACLLSQKPQIVVSKVYTEVKTNTSRNSPDIKEIQAEMGEEVAAQLPQQPVCWNHHKLTYFKSPSCTWAHCIYWGAIYDHKFDR